MGSIAEIQIDGTPYQRLNVTERERAPLSHLLDFTGDRTTDVDDIVVGTKVRLVPEAPGVRRFALRFATKLPNASNESGLGTDTMDFYFAALVGKTVQSVRFVGNVGFGILSDPIEATRTERRGDLRLLDRARGCRGSGDRRRCQRPRGLRSGRRRAGGTENRGIVRFGGRFTRWHRPPRRRHHRRPDLARSLVRLHGRPDLGVPAFTVCALA